MMRSTKFQFNTSPYRKKTHSASQDSYLLETKNASPTLRMSRHFGSVGRSPSRLKQLSPGSQKQVIADLKSPSSVCDDDPWQTDKAYESYDPDTYHDVNELKYQDHPKLPTLPLLDNENVDEAYGATTCEREGSNRTTCETSNDISENDDQNSHKVQHDQLVKPLSGTRRKSSNEDLREHNLSSLDTYLANAALDARKETDETLQDGLLASVMSPDGRFRALTEHLILSQTQTNNEDTKLDGNFGVKAKKLQTNEEQKSILHNSDSASTAHSFFDVLVAFDEAEAFVHNRIAYLSDLSEGKDLETERLRKYGDSQCLTNSPNKDIFSEDHNKSKSVNIKGLYELLMSRRDALRQRALGLETQPITEPLGKDLTKPCSPHTQEFKQSVPSDEEPVCEESNSNSNLVKEVSELKEIYVNLTTPEAELLVRKRGTRSTYKVREGMDNDEVFAWQKNKTRETQAKTPHQRKRATSPSNTSERTPRNDIVNQSGQMILPRLTSLIRGGQGRFAQEHQRVTQMRMNIQANHIGDIVSPNGSRSGIFIERTTRLAQKSHSALLITLLQQKHCNQLESVWCSFKAQKGETSEDMTETSLFVDPNTSCSLPKSELQASCATNQMEECAAYLLQQKADPNYIDPDGATPLMLALQMENSLRLSALLLKEGAEPNLTLTHTSGRFYGCTALDIALILRLPQHVKMLLAHGAFPTRFSCVPDPSDEDVALGLVAATRQRNIALLERATNQETSDNFSDHEESSVARGAKSESAYKVVESNSSSHQCSVDQFVYPLLRRFPLHACLSFLRNNNHLLAAIDNASKIESFVPKDNAFLADDQGLTVAEFAKQHGFEHFAKACLNRRLWNIVCHGTSLHSQNLILQLDIQPVTHDYLPKLAELAGSMTGLTLDERSDEYTWENDEDSVHGVLLHGASVDTNSQGVLLLNKTRSLGKEIDFLFSSFFETCQTDIEAKTLLYIKQLKPLVEALKHVSGSTRKLEISPQGSRGGTPLVASLRAGRPYEFVKLLLDWDASVDVSDFDGNRPLTLALLRTSMSSNKVVELLLDRGATPLSRAPVLSDNSEQIAWERLVSYMPLKENYIPAWLKAAIQHSCESCHFSKTANDEAHFVKPVYLEYRNKSLDTLLSLEVLHWLASKLLKIPAFDPSCSIRVLLTVVQQALETSVLALAEQTVTKSSILHALALSAEAQIKTHSTNFTFGSLLHCKILCDLGLESFVDSDFDYFGLSNILMSHVIMSLMKIYVNSLREQATQLEIVDIEQPNEPDFGAESNSVNVKIEAQLRELRQCYKQNFQDATFDNNQKDGFVSQRRAHSKCRESQQDQRIKRSRSDGSVFLKREQQESIGVSYPAKEDHLKDDIFSQMLNN